MNTYLSSNLCGVAIQDWRVSIGIRDLKGLSSGSGGGNDGVKSLEEGGAVGLAFLALNSPSLVPGHVLAGLRHVVAMPSGDGDEGDSHGVVADLLDEARDFLLDLLEPSLAVWWLGRVHLVDRASRASKVSMCLKTSTP